MPLPDLRDLWDYDHPERSEAVFRALLPEVEAAGDQADLAELLTQIARAQGLQRQFAEAHATLDSAERRLTEEMPRARARYLLERGRVYNSSGAPERACPLFAQAWEIAGAAGEDFYAVDAAHMLGIAAPTPEERQTWNERALAQAEVSADPRARAWRGSLLNNMGWTAHDRGDYSTALSLFERALACREEQGTPREIRIAAWCVARCLRSLGRVEEALERQRALAAEWERAGGSDGYVEEELGECLLALGRLEEARPWFAHAYARLSADPWLRAEQPARLERLKGLGDGERTD